MCGSPPRRGSVGISVVAPSVNGGPLLQNTHQFCALLRSARADPSIGESIGIARRIANIGECFVIAVVVTFRTGGGGQAHATQRCAMSIDFDGISARLLASAETLIPQWVPGGRWRGNEYVSGSVLGGAGESFSVNKLTGKFADFASDGVRGGDLIALYASIHGLSQADAARELEPEAQRVTNGANGHAKSAPRENPALPAPIDYPDLPSWEGLRPGGIYPYFADDEDGPLFVVCRYDPAGSPKEIRPYTWRNERWSSKHHPEPRVLYRLRALLAAPQVPVLIVEGERCADVATESLLGSYCVTTWSGGANAHSKTDFSPLYGRDITIWPDADDPGRKAAAEIAAKLAPHAKSLRVLAIPKSVPEGWDCADALIAQVDLAEFIAKYSIDVAQPRSGDAASGPRSPNPKRITRAQPQRPEGDTVHEDGQVDESAYSQWERLGLARGDKGAPFNTADNVERIVLRHTDYAQRLHLDTFRMRKILTLEDGSEREWVDADTLRTMIWIQRALHIPKMKIGEVRHGVEAAAARNQRNSLTLWLTGLEWDGIERLPNLMVDVFHAEPSQYASDVGRCWLVSMIARAFNPGCQVDTMVVLEGGQGTYKSSALSILGGAYYAALPAAFGTRDFLQALDGMWLVEIPDMSGFKGRDIDHVKAIITTRQDRYCRRYSHDAETYPRQCVFAATANTDDWNEDPTGARRFLPIKVGAEVELALLRSIRDQLLSEALHRFKTGEKWWDIQADEARTEQGKRRPDDSWTPRVRAALCSIRIKSPPDWKQYVTVARIFDELTFDMHKQGKAEQMRMARILSALGWIKVTKWLDGETQKVWREP
jgi:putative DNA primase/helicase